MKTLQQILVSVLNFMECLRNAFDRDLQKKFHKRQETEFKEIRSFR
jgi:hypothetical protein